MLWSEVLDGWENGDVVDYPDDIDDLFVWRTSPVSSDEDEEFHEDFIYDSRLTTYEDLDTFSEYFDESDDPDVVAFLNLPRDTVLVVPMPREERNFSSIKEFIDKIKAVHAYQDKVKQVKKKENEMRK